MPLKLTDDEVRRLRALWADEGWSLADLAGEFGISQQYAGRLVQGAARPLVAGLDADRVAEGVEAAVEAFVAELELDLGLDVLARTALTLARSLDAAAASDSVGGQQATPRIAAQLVAVLDRLRGAVPGEPDALDLLRQRREARRLAAMTGAAA